MAILRLSIRPSDPCFFAIFKPTILKFLILIGDCMRINDTFGFSDLMSIGSEIELALGPSQIRIFLITFHHFLRIFTIAIKFRVGPMIYVGDSNH
jgi:hypothetical protein